MQKCHHPFDNQFSLLASLKLRCASAAVFSFHKFPYTTQSRLLSCGVCVLVECVVAKSPQKIVSPPPRALQPSESPLEIRCMARMLIIFLAGWLAGWLRRRFRWSVVTVACHILAFFHSPSSLPCFSHISLFLAAIHNSHAPCDGPKGRTNVLDSLGSCRRSCGTGFELWLPMVGAGDE